MSWRGRGVTITSGQTVAVTSLAIHNVLESASVIQRNAVPHAGDVQDRPGRKATVPFDAMQREFLGAVEAAYDAVASPAVWSCALAEIAAVAGAKAGIVLFGSSIEELAPLATFGLGERSALLAAGALTAAFMSPLDASAVGALVGAKPRRASANGVGDDALTAFGVSGRVAESVGVNLLREEATVGAMWLFRRVGGRFDLSSLETLQGIVPHLTRAMAVHLRVERAERHAPIRGPSSGSNGTGYTPEQSKGRKEFAMKFRPVRPSQCGLIGLVVYTIVILVMSVLLGYVWHVGGWPEHLLGLVCGSLAGLFAGEIFVGRLSTPWKALTGILSSLGVAAATPQVVHQNPPGDTIQKVSNWIKVVSDQIVAGLGIIGLVIPVGVLAPAILAFLLALSVVTLLGTTLAWTKASPGASTATFLWEPIAGREQLYVRAVKLLKSAGSVLDTTWGRNPRPPSDAEKRARDLYLAAQQSAVERGTDYKALFGGPPENLTEAADLARQHAHSSHFQARTLTGLAAEVSMIDFLVTDQHEVLLSHVDADFTPTYLYIRSEQLAKMFTNWFRECWSNAMPVSNS